MHKGNSNQRIIFTLNVCNIDYMGFNYDTTHGFITACITGFAETIISCFCLEETKCCENKGGEQFHTIPKGVATTLAFCASQTVGLNSP